MKYPSIFPLAAGAFLSLASASFAETAATIPEGYVTVTIAGSVNGTTYNQTPFSAAFLSATGVTGQATGRITAVTSNTITNSNAGWTSSALAATGSPYFINFTGGTNAGRMFQITANTATQLTVNTQGLDLSTLSFAVGASGDTYEIVQGDTLLGILGTPAEGVVGGTSTDFSANTIDKVAVNDPLSGVAFTYYYDTSATQWRRLGSVVNQGNLVISPKSGLHYSRISTSPLALQFLGRVPTTASKHQIPASGTTILSNYFPVDTTLDGLNIHNIVGWRKANESGITVETSDRVVLKVGTILFSYYFDSTLGQWRRLGSGINQGGVSVPAGSAVRVIRSGTPGTYHTWNYALPYSIS